VAVAEDTRTQVRAEARYVRTAPRKAQLVAEQIRGRPVPEARTILAFMTRDAARDVESVLSSAVANAEQNHNLDADELYVSVATVGAGPTLKRWRARARGRVARIKKRTCHITIALALPEGEVIPAPRPAPAAKPEPAAEEEAKPKRAPRKKAAPTAETSTEEKPKAETSTEEKPKAARKPRAKKADEKEPKARTTKKSSGSTSKRSSRKSKKESDS
jgi:large subunit ribosomal protein L22